jgi:hypothetical protein
MHQSALQESAPFYLGIVLIMVIFTAFIYNYKNTKK